MLSIVLGLLFLPLTGCGTQQESDAQHNWESRLGAAWDSYSAGYRAGWTTGCESAVQLLVGEDPTLRFSPPTCDFPTYAGESLNVPETAPSSPRSAGYLLGLSEGCLAIFSERQREGEGFRRCRAARLAIAR